MVWHWWLLHCRVVCSGLLMRLVWVVGRDRELDEEEWVSFDRVSAVLEDTFRASSAVECMNSVLRMHQARHRHVSQGMLDLKRLYWNCRAFTHGMRRGASPYQLLGLNLPTDDWWKLLQMEPEALRQKLSTQEVTV